MSGTLQTPYQRQITAPAVPVQDVNGGAFAAIQAGAQEVQDFAVKLKLADNADRLNTAQAAATQDLDTLSLNFANDTDPATAASRFADQATQIRDKHQADLAGDPESTAAYTHNIGTLIEARRVDVAGDAAKRLNEDANANVQDALEQYQRAFAASRNPSEMHAIAAQASDTVSNAVRTGVMRAPAAQSLMQKWREGVATLQARRAVDTNPAGAIKLIQSGAFPDLDPLEGEREIERAQAEVLARQREASAQLRDAKADAREAVAGLDTVVQAGVPISAAAADQVRALVARTGDRTIADHLDRTISANNTVIALRGSTPAELHGAIGDLEARAAKEGLDGKTAAVLVAARQFAQAQATGLRDDPLSYAAAQGRAQVPPLDLAKATPQDWAARIQTADRVSQYYGTAPAYLTKDELDTLKGALAPTQPLAGRVAIAGALVKALDNKSLSVFAQIAPDNPVVANAGALMLHGNTAAARDALNGQTLLHNAADGKQTDLRPTPAGRNALPSVGALSVATGISGSSGRGQILSTADAIYAARAGALGLTGADLGRGDARARDLYVRALNEAAGARYDNYGNQWGGLAHYNGVAVIAPTGIPAAQFEDAVHGLSEKALTTHSIGGAAPVVGGQALKPADLGRLFVVTVGDDRYALSTTDPSQGAIRPVHDAKGRPYKFSLLQAFR